jgi:hypothetical protein
MSAFASRLVTGTSGSRKELREFGCRERSNAEFSARNEFGMGSEFQSDARSEVGHLIVDGGRIQKTNNMGIVSIDGAVPGVGRSDEVLRSVPAADRGTCRRCRRGTLLASM